MMYPIPYPSAATGPKPNSRNAGFPQLDVDKMDVLSVRHPGSVKIAGSGGLSSLVLDVTLPPGDGGASSASRFASRSR